MREGRSQAGKVRRELLQPPTVETEVGAILSAGLQDGGRGFD